MPCNSKNKPGYHAKSIHNESLEVTKLKRNEYSANKSPGNNSVRLLNDKKSINDSSMNSSKNKCRTMSKEDSDQFYSRMMSYQRSKRASIDKIKTINEITKRNQEFNEMNSSINTKSNFLYIIVMSKKDIEEMVGRFYNEAKNKQEYNNYLVKAKEQMIKREVMGYFRPRINTNKSLNVKKYLI